MPCTLSCVSRRDWGGAEIVLEPTFPQLNEGDLRLPCAVQKPRRISRRWLEKVSVDARQLVT